MSRIFFILLLSLLGLIRAPISLLLIVLRNFVPFIKRRIDFERKNLLEAECRSFRKDGLIADYCFEVSSEGELEQVRPLLLIYLQRTKKIEILFSSPSVESKCLALAREFKDQIRLLRLPLMSFSPVSFLFFQSPWQWVSAPKILLCRYDFFPEILTFKWLGKKLILLSAAGKKPSWFKTQAYDLFDIIVAANLTEEHFFKKNFPTKKSMAFDFRVPRIFERVQNAAATLAKTDFLQNYLSFLDARCDSSKIVLGSAWESDLGILENAAIKQELKSGKIHLVIVPHNLNAKTIETMKSVIKARLPGIALYEISKNASSIDREQFESAPGVVLLNVGGILCELYTKFRFSYVGGGYERSIHSVLEPYLAGSQVVIGPLIHRSTEYDYIKEISPDEIHLLKNPESFYNLFKEHGEKLPDLAIRNSLCLTSLTQMESVINEIESC